MSDHSAPRLARLLDSMLAIRTGEAAPTLLSFLLIFILMAAYYVLRPLRDALASDWSDAEVSLLWTVNFFLCAAVVAAYGWAVSHLRLRYIVPGIYALFALSFALFSLLLGGGEADVLTDQAFYVWVSVFSLFHVSVFWSFMADVFNREQARRLFPVIAAGASAGALLGPSVPTLLAGALGTGALLLIAALMLLMPLPLAIMLERLKVRVPLVGDTLVRDMQVTPLVRDRHATDQPGPHGNREGPNQDRHVESTAATIGGHPLRGFALFVTEPKLLGIGCFILLFTMVGSFVYFEQKNLLEVYDRATRTRLLGMVDWVTNVLTFTLAFFATSRIVRTLGMGLTLALLPVLAGAGLLLLAFTPIVAVVLGLQVARRAGEYAVTRPAREMLFTQVDRETRFKAKPVIDTVVYRGGDMVTSWLFAGLTQGLGLGLGAVALVGALIAGAWATVGYQLGRAFERSPETSVTGRAGQS